MATIQSSWDRKDGRLGIADLVHGISTLWQQVGPAFGMVGVRDGSGRILQAVCLAFMREFAPHRWTYSVI